MNKLITSTDAARLLKLSPRTLEKWRSTGLGPPFRKLGGAVRHALAAPETVVIATKYQRYSASQRMLSGLEKFCETWLARLEGIHNLAVAMLWLRSTQISTQIVATNLEVF